MIIKNFYMRPLCFICAFFILGTAATGFISDNPLLILLSFSVIASTAFAALTFAFRNDTAKKRIFLAFALSIFSFAAGIGMTFLRVKLPLASYTERYCAKTEKIIGIVTKRNIQENYLSAYTVKVEKIGGKRVHLNASLEAEYSLDLTAGERIEATVEISEYTPFDSSRVSSLYAKADNLVFTFTSYNGESIAVTGKSNSPAVLLSKFRARLSADISRISARDSSGLIPALLIGDRDGLSESVRRDFRRLGLAHILAVSGMHLSIVISAFGYLLHKFGFSMRTRKLIPIFAVVLYAAVTGFSMSVLRASFMTVLCFGGAFFGRRNDSVTSLFLAVAVILTVTPSAVYDIGLILSFTATLGIVTVGHGIFDYAEKTDKKRAEKKKKKSKENAVGILKFLLSSARFIKITVITSASAMIFSLPFIIMFFDEASAFSFASNIVFLPLIELILYISPLILIFPILPKAAFFFGSAASLLSDFTVSLAEALASRISAVFTLHNDVVPFTIFLCIILCIPFFSVKVKRRKIAFASFAVIMILLLPAFAVIANFNPTSNTTLYYYTDAEKNTVPKSANEFLIFKSSEKLGFSDKIILCDISDGRYSSYKGVMQRLKNDVHESDVDSLLLTHYHTKHLTTLPKFFDAYYIRRLYLPVPQNDDDYKIAVRLAEIAESHGIDTGFILPKAKNNLKTSEAYSELLRNESFEVSSSFTEHAGNGITLNLSGNALISRSEHPVISLTGSVNAEGGKIYTFSYEGAAYPEADFGDEYEISVLQSNIEICGLHSPVSHDAAYHPTVTAYSAKGFSVKVLYNEK